MRKPPFSQRGIRPPLFARRILFAMRFLAASVLVVLAAGCSGSGRCDRDNPCAAGEVCVRGACDVLPDLGGSCDACPQGQQCVRGQDFPQGACELACDAGSDCPALSTCTALATWSYCLRDCDGDDDCPPSQRCERLAGNAVCVARQAPASFGQFCSGKVTLKNGGLVGPSTQPSACQKPLIASALPQEQVQHLGVHPVGEAVAFTVPPGQASLTVVSQAVSAVDSITFEGQPVHNSAVPLLLRGPDGGVLFDDSLPQPYDPTSVPMFYANLTPTIGTMTYPNTRRALDSVTAAEGVPAGSWSVTVSDYGFECLGLDQCAGGSDAGVYDLTVVTRPDAALKQGTIDVAIYLVTESRLTAALAIQTISFHRAIAALAQIYDAAGICLGTVTVYDVPAWAKAAYASSIDVDKDGSCDPLHQLFTLSQPGNTLNFFFVDALDSTIDHGGTVVGFDGTIPGPSSFGGSVSSGAAVSIADLGAGSCGSAIDPLHCGADEVGVIAAHEGAHWLGLYHTTEGSGMDFDPLGDTPACLCPLCVPVTQEKSCGSASPTGTTTFVSAIDCLAGTVACGGADNLMFWQLSAFSKGALTPEQARVMVANPLVH